MSERRTTSRFRSLRSNMKTKLSACARGTLLPRAACALSVCGTLAFFAGCAAEPASHVVSAPPPLPPNQAASAPVVYSAPNAPAAVAVPSPTGASSIVVMQAPPAPQQEVPSARPSSTHVWVPGSWSWRNNSYQWTAGHWEVPPRVGAVWVPARWQPEGTSWRFYEGYWD
jgi:hypothetical protein